MTSQEEKQLLRYVGKLRDKGVAVDRELLGVLGAEVMKQFALKQLSRWNHWIVVGQTVSKGGIGYQSMGLNRAIWFFILFFGNAGCVQVQQHDLQAQCRICKRTTNGGLI